MAAETRTLLPRVGCVGAGQAEGTHAESSRCRASAGCLQQGPQLAGCDAGPQGPGAAHQACGCTVVALATLAAGHREGAAVGGHSAVGARRGAGLHDQDATGAGCGERRRLCGYPVLCASCPAPGRPEAWDPSIGTTGTACACWETLGRPLPAGLGVAAWRSGFQRDLLLRAKSFLWHKGTCLSSDQAPP